jgi:soluble lytic murein transglycosylase-like protein
MMTTIQIGALIILIALAALLLWGGYIIGRSDGLETGLREGEDIQRAASAKTISELRASLQFIRADHTRLAQTCKRLEAPPLFGPAEHQTLVAIGELLRIAGETFSAFRTGKKLERDARSLRDQALAMAAQLQTGIQGSLVGQPLGTANQFTVEAT